MRNFGQGADWMTERTFEDINTLGVYGDIRDRPNEADLTELEQRIGRVLRSVVA
jgi:hypothetical protein